MHDPWMLQKHPWVIRLTAWSARSLTIWLVLTSALEPRGLRQSTTAFAKLSRCPGDAGRS
jgi:hypothetical protein